MNETSVFFFIYRMVLSLGEVEEITHILPTTTLKEGDMWGHDVANINRWVDSEGKLILKFIILYIVLRWNPSGN